MLSSLVSLQTPLGPTDFMTILADNTAAHCRWWRHGLSGFRKNFAQGDKSTAQAVSGLFRFFSTRFHLPSSHGRDESSKQRERDHRSTITRRSTVTQTPGSHQTNQEREEELRVQLWAPQASNDSQTKRQTSSEKPSMQYSTSIADQLTNPVKGFCLLRGNPDSGETCTR